LWAILYYRECANIFGVEEHKFICSFGVYDGIAPYELSKFFTKAIEVRMAPPTIITRVYAPYASTIGGVLGYGSILPSNIGSDRVLATEEMQLVS